MLTLGTAVIWCSVFKTAAVIKPPKETEPLIVTKSPTTQPCDESVAVITAEPSVAAKEDLYENELD